VVFSFRRGDIYLKRIRPGWSMDCSSQKAFGNSVAGAARRDGFIRPEYLKSAGKFSFLPCRRMSAYPGHTPRSHPSLSFDIIRIVTIKTGTGMFLAVCLCYGSSMAQTNGNSELKANDFARKILLNEVKAEEQDHTHWMLKLETEKPRGKEVDEVVETKYADLRRHEVINGRPLTPRQEHAEDKRIQKLIRNPAMLRKSMKSENEDSNRSQKMLKMLPDALIFSYGKRQGDTVELHFEPNPNFRPSSHEAQVFRALEGDMLLNAKQGRLAEMSGHLKGEVKFGGGWLGHLDKGGQFEVKQTEVAAGYWELTLLHVNMKGKALFFKTINVQQNVRRSNFRRVSDDLTLSQAADILRQQTVAVNGADHKVDR
ncbi:MAG: hypothetical protein ACRD2S_10920, partial [Terriglobales bacterium]